MNLNGKIAEIREYFEDRSDCDHNVVNFVSNEENQMLGVLDEILDYAPGVRTKPSTFKTKKQNADKKDAITPSGFAKAFFEANR